MKKYTLALLAGFAQIASAQTAPAPVSTQFVSLRGFVETCRIPNHISIASYSAKDLETEAKLCSFDFYTNVAICPKLNSTNPGVLVHKIPKGSTREQAMQECSITDNSLSTEAKFKQSISCSYSPSIIGYYHLSRILGGAGRVVPVVQRNMDVQEHMDVVDNAQRYLQRQVDKGQLAASEVIIKTWASFKNYVYANPANYPQIISADQQSIYGALQSGVKGEGFYSAINGSVSHDAAQQAINFSSTPAFKINSNPSGIATQVDSTDFQTLMPVLIQQKDLSDMILMDTLMNQQDRMGNIHYKYAWYYIEDGSMKRKSSDVKVEKVITIPDEEKAFAAQKNAVIAKELIMKDNDCGLSVNKMSNFMRLNSMLEKVRHMSGKTYGKLMKLAANLNQAETEKFFREELMFTKADFNGPTWNSFSNNVAKARQILLTNCKSGELKLDLDPELHFGLASANSNSCDQ